MHKTRLAAAVLISAVAAAGTAGCGGSSHPSALTGTPTDIADRAYQALGSAPSVTMTFTENDGDAKSDVKLTLDAKGDCSGSFTSDAASFEILKVGTTSWIKMSSETALIGLVGPDKAHRAVGKYLPLADHPNLASFVKACDLKSEIAAEDRPDAVTQVGTTTVDGIATAEFKEHDSGGDTLTWVTVRGAPEIVKIQTPQVTAYFSDYAKPVSFRAPSAAEVA
ncbi:hypothetical protein HH310_21675 [Actinoplanes sp. TBRC 11911]|uniref:hypothetical protein n=1 Tax=Actinoplanes sp. TBRC 11911 TaxID=2729386 RepID=UPI00145D70FC|nr:hypothetical protein [Actinoplanes sp. TBRC 11911]NMO53780.1 hypothetical protein [Actinoplanes sp. TBRC 11911]